MDDLSARSKETLSFLNSQVQDTTLKARAESWVANVQANRKHFTTPNPPLLGVTAFVVAAGPSLKQNVQALKKVGRMGVIVCVDAVYRYLIENGIVPDYCVTLDADARMITMIEGADTSRTCLIAQASASPAFVDYWKGPKYFLRATGGGKDIDDKLHAAHRIVKAKRTIMPGEELDPINDIEVVFPGLNDALACGGNVTTYAHVFALSLLRATKVIFAGADYSWKSDLDFYAGASHTNLAAERIEGENVFSHKIIGGELQTNFTLFHLKTWHEDLAKAHLGHCVNATEGGILGVNKVGETMAGWEIMPLDEAIEKYAPKARAREAVAV